MLHRNTIKLEDLETLPNRKKDIQTKKGARSLGLYHGMHHPGKKKSE
jgi:hypothetical protein